jgi:hypothetical protein
VDAFAGARRSGRRAFRPIGPGGAVDDRVSGAGRSGAEAR